MAIILRETYKVRTVVLESKDLVFSVNPIQTHYLFYTLRGDMMSQNNLLYFLISPPIGSGLNLEQSGKV